MSNIPFRVVRGLEERILNTPFTDGYLYIANDTKRIYMDSYLNGIQQNKMPIGGGNSGIYYSSKTFTDSSDLTFNLSDIEGKELPAVNDLIINYKSKNETRDGFYKVITTDTINNKVETEYLSVGGGGNGGGAATSGGQIKIIPITPTAGTTTKEQGYSIDYSIEAYNNANIAVITPGKATFIINGVQIDGGEVSHGNTYSFPVTEYLSSVKDTNVITLKVTLNTGGIVDDVQTFTWTVKCVDLRLIWDWNYNSNNYIKEDIFVLNWKVSGGVNCVTHISIDDGSQPDENYFTVNLSSTQFEGSKALQALSYGAHKFTMWVTAFVGGINISTNKVEHMLTFIKGDETSPILTVPYFVEKARQYDTIRIPFLVYRPGAEKLKVSFYVDNVEVLTDEYATTVAEPHYWPYTLGRAGEVKLKIAFTSFPDIFYETILQVAPLDLGIQEPTEGKTFSLKASDISGNAQLKQLEAEGKISFSSNFDWSNGGLQTEIDDKGNISNYICVRQGTTMTINYKLFESSQVSTQGKTFKFCFKAMNCYDYEAPVLECYEESTKLGLKFTAQQALFSSATNPSFATQYCEGSYIELETEIWPDQADNGYRPGDRFLMFWVDGVPAGVEIFDTGAVFKQNIPKTITIGSDQCDVCVYIIKIYEKKLSALEHLNNFILDAPNVNEKLARFERNDIIGSNNEISYEKLVTKNPGCHAYLYKLTENGMTTSKEDEKDCDYTEYYLTSNKPCLTAKNAKIMVQGTSSAAYGVAAFNVRTDFGDTTMYDGDGNVLEGRKVSETSIPVDFTCTKVNVASCENANNALNAEWYNRYQPYYDGHRRQSTSTKQYRDCMEFDFGVVFIEDHNKNTNYKDADGKPDKSLYTSTNVFALNTEGELDNTYVSSPYYKQYAVGNMGNDKKNTKVFHDVKNPKVCCVEVLDNQNAEHWMTKTVTLDDFVWSDEDDGFYEFRYSVKKCKAEDKQGITEEIQAQNFINFVNWMAALDPSPYDPDKHPHGYTGRKLESPKTFAEKTFTGFTPAGWDNSTSSGVSLAGFTTSKYAKTYEYDTKEYRIAKMLDECEDHLIMDSVVYHYLFIQRHTMVDNVAKNTFWSTEDGQHWDLTKNYDNDTSDGNDNSGYLRYGYGKEILDKREDGADVFNASDSVWLNFIFNLPDVQEDLYKKLLNKKINGVGVWDSAGYLKLFKEKQSLIPERCWIDDYFRKYIRPRRLGLDGDKTFSQRLEGGLKTHQRQQYEKYQSYYIDSKYCAGASFNDTGSLDMRLNKGNAVYKLTEDTVVVQNKNYFELKTVGSGDMTWEDYVRVNIEDPSINPSALNYYEIVSGGWTKNEKFPTSYYITLYPSAKIGGQIWRSPTRLQKGQTINIPVGQLLDAPTDATCYIYAANMIQTIKGISDTYPNYIGISAASKLRELEAGSASFGYFNDKLNNAVLNENTQLEKAQLQQVGSDKLSGLDLSKLTMLKELKINLGSKFPSLKLAKGGIINTLYLNPLNTLNVKELSLLTDFQYDNDIFNSLNHICIQSCPALNDFSYNLVKANNITNYCFNDIEWKVPTTDIDIAQGKINVLEYLLESDEDGNKKKQPYEVTMQSLALTGKVIVNLDNSIADKAVQEYSIYENYKKEFPNLNIEYSGNLKALNKAYNVIFYNGYNTTTETYGDVIYQVKTNGSKTLGWLTSNAGPTGTAIPIPTRESDKEYDYTWKETWIDENGEIYDALKFANYIPTSDKIFIAEYVATKHPYSITLRDYDGSNIEHNIETQYYGTDITEQMPYYLYRPHPTEGMRYEFQGWISARDYLGNVSNPEIITNFIVTDDITYYAFYQEQNCTSVSSKMDYFQFIGDGYTISLKDKYRYLIQEPITLPLKNGNKIINTVGNFGVYEHQNSSETVKIPSIYFLNNGNGGGYTRIEDYAFWSAAQGSSVNQNRLLLQHVYLPSSITSIGQAAFQGCKKLKTINLPNALNDDCGIKEFGMYAFDSTGNIIIDENNEYKPLIKVERIGVAAFYQAGPEVYLSKISNQLKNIPAFAFYNCANVAINDFTTVESMGQQAFSGCGKYTNIDIILPQSLASFANNCFENYAKGNINTITYVGGSSVDNAELARLGLSYSNPITIEQVVDK